MAAIPLDYTRNLDRALEGTIADTSHKLLVSRQADVKLGFGKVVLQGAHDRSVTLPGATPASPNGAYIGITVRDQGVSPAEPNAFAQGDEALLMEEGSINVVLAATVAAGDAAAFLDANGDLVPSGTAASTDIPTGRFLRAGVAGEIGELRLG